MRLVVIEGPLSRILLWTQRALFAGAAMLLAYCGFVLMDAWIFQQRAARELDRQLKDERAAGISAPRAGPSVSPGAVAAIGPDGLIGRIEIPRLGLSAIVAEGIDRKTLRRAVGHIPRTGLPGQNGNVGIAGHRDTFFRPLRNIVENDIITLSTLAGEYRYRVVSIKVVGPADVAVLDPSKNEILTLVTCYPFYFVGSAPDRFIVRAERVA
jgi:sortase A